MLIGLRVANFRSFWSEQELSFVTTADHAHETTHCIRTGIRAAPRISRVALIFGPNASGKSNLVRALATFREIVLKSNSFDDIQFAERYTPFHFRTSSSQPTRMEIEVMTERIRYRYTIAYTSERITAERLLVYRTGKAQRWFERQYSEARRREEWAPFSPYFSGPREVWRKATRPKALFLTTAALLNSELLRPLFNWFQDCFEMVFPGDIADAGKLAAHVRDRDLKARMLRIVRSADLPIDDLRVVPRPEGSAAGPLVEFLHSRRSEKPVWLNIAYASAGTQRLLGLLGPLLHALDQSKLLVIDEFDTSLHPLLARYFIRLINYPALAARRAQLLLTSQNATLMDLDILRRDEIWLVELDQTDASVLSRILRSSPRKKAVLGKAYLKGRYGAVPNIHPEILGRTGAAVAAQAVNE
jgi:uncharacterized protein